MNLVDSQFHRQEPKTDWFSIILLTIAAIVFVTAELLPVGILPQISHSFAEPIGKVGLMVTGYAWSVALSAMLITSLFAPIKRRTLLVIMMSLFAVANFMVAMSPTLTVLFIARVIGAFSHGVFWSTVGPVCMRLSGHSAKARATSIVFGGIAVATVVAVPIGTLLTQWLGWRAAFTAIAGLSLFLAIAISWRFPALTSDSRGYLKQLPKLLRYRLIWRLCPATVLSLTGHFCAFTYISVLLEKNIGITASHLALYLFLFGAAGILGNVFAGVLTDKQLRRASQCTMLAMALVIILFALLPVGSSLAAAILIIVWGAGICLLTVTLQSLILTLPIKLNSAASALHVSMFNLGIGSGAFIGGLLVDHVSLSAVLWVGGASLLLAAINFSFPFDSKLSHARFNYYKEKTHE